MPSKNETALSEYFQKRYAPGRNYNYDKDEEYKKYVQSIRIRESEAMNSGLDNGLSFEEISSNTGLSLNHIKQFAEKTRPGYGVQPPGKGLLNTVKDIGYDVVGRPLSNFSKGLSSAATAGGELDKIAEGQRQQQEAFQRYAKDFREKKIDKKRYDALVKSLERPDLIAQSEQILEDTNPQRFAASAVETAGLVAGGALGSKVGTAGKVLIGAGEGAVLGGAAEAQREGNTRESIIKNAALGGLFGGAIGYGAGKLSELGEAKRFVKDYQARRVLDTLDNTPEAVQPITDVTRLLPANASPIERVAKINDDIEKAMKEGGENVEDLLAERQALLQDAKANPSPASQANAEFIEQTTSAALKNQALMDPTLPSPKSGKTKTPRAAQRLSEATGVPTDATYTTLPDAVQESSHQTLMNNNPELLERIVKGEVNGLQFGVTNEYAAAKAASKAAKSGDKQVIRDIATGKVLTEASIKGQGISSLRHLDTYSPVRVVKRVTEARKAAAKSGKLVPADVTDTEIEQLLVRSNSRDRLYDKYISELESGTLSDKTRLEYGKAVVDFNKYSDDLMPGKSISDWVKQPGGAVLDVAGTTKSLRATGDLSATLRQGLKLLGTGKYKIWAKSAAKQVKAAVQELGGENAMDWHLADLYSRPNYVNGNYKRFGVAVGDVVEEAFPSKALDKVPVLRRIYNASDSAYTIFNQQARADLADDLFDKAVKSGVDLSQEGKQIAAMANALTSRGNLGKLEGSAANALNSVFFSPRLLKSNIDVLGGHLISGGAGSKALTEGSNFVRKEAAKNLLKMAATAFAIYKTAESIRPESVEWDTRSSNFGKIKVGNTRFDITGGMGSLITLGGRLNGIGILPGDPSTKSSNSDAVSKLNDKENDPFSRTYFDLIGDFASNKLSPAARALTDYLQGEDFSGHKPTVGSTVRSLTFPIAVDNYKELKDDKNAAPILASMILEGLGVSTNTYDSTDDWTVRTTKPQKGFQKAVSAETFKKANEAYNQRFTDWFREVRYTDQYRKLSDDGKRKMLLQAGDDLEKKVMKEYGYTYKAEDKKKDNSTDTLISELTRQLR